MKRFASISRNPLENMILTRPYSLSIVQSKKNMVSCSRQLPKLMTMQKCSYTNTSMRSNEPPKPSSSTSTSEESSKKETDDKTAVIGKAIRMFVAAAVLGFAITNEPWKWFDEKKADSTAKKELDLAEIQSIITDRVYLDIQFPNQTEPERIIIGLYGKECPKTVQNFKSLCDGFVSPSSSQPLTYKGCKIHRVIPGFMLQSGDYTRGNGTGGRSIFDTPMFADESFALQHKGLGIVSMANRGPHTNSSQFFICFEATPWLDQRHVVFGQVLSGIATLKKIEEFGTRSGTVKEELRIVDCGSLPALEETLTMNNSSEVLDETGHNVKRIMK